LVVGSGSSLLAILNWGAAVRIPIRPCYGNLQREEAGHGVEYREGGLIPARVRFSEVVVYGICWVGIQPLRQLDACDENLAIVVRRRVLGLNPRVGGAAIVLAANAVRVAPQVAAVVLDVRLTKRPLILSVNLAGVLKAVADFPGRALPFWRVSRAHGRCETISAVDTAIICRRDVDA